MSETAKSKSQPHLEPIICNVVTPIEQKIWGQPRQPHRGSVTFDIKESNKIKNLIFVTAAYQKIKIPYRFTLLSCEIVYENKHIKTIKMAGLYLSGIDPIKVEAQLSTWKTEPPTETFLDDDDEIAMSEEYGQQCYFIAHRKGEEFHVAWNLAENFDICQNPQNYSGIQWYAVDFTK